MQSHVWRVSCVCVNVKVLRIKQKPQPSDRTKKMDRKISNLCANKRVGEGGNGQQLYYSKREQMPNACKFKWIVSNWVCDMRARCAMLGQMVKCIRESALQKLIRSNFG